MSLAKALRRKEGRLLGLLKLAVSSSGGFGTGEFASAGCSVLCVFARDIKKVRLSQIRLGDAVFSCSLISEEEL